MRLKVTIAGRSIYQNALGARQMQIAASIVRKMTAAFHLGRGAVNERHASASADLPSRVSVYEVSPSDGLQNESAQVATHAKVRLDRRARGCGYQPHRGRKLRIAEVGPADGRRGRGVPDDRAAAGRHLRGLCPNERGLERAPRRQGRRDRGLRERERDPQLEERQQDRSRRHCRPSSRSSGRPSREG